MSVGNSRKRWSSLSDYQELYQQKKGSKPVLLILRDRVHRRQITLAFPKVELNLTLRGGGLRNLEKQELLLNSSPFPSLTFELIQRVTLD